MISTAISSTRRTPTTDVAHIGLHGSPRIYYSDYSSAFLDALAIELRENAADSWCIYDNTAAGAALPSVSQVAADYQLNPITVSRAYQELVDDALVEKRRGLGMYVMDGARDKLLASERERFLREEWPALLEHITRLDLNLEQLLQAKRDGGANGENA